MRKVIAAMKLSIDSKIEGSEVSPTGWRPGQTTTA